MSITKREQEVLNYICEGYSDDEIAQTLYISVSTVKLHVHHLLKKLKLRDRTQLAIFTLKNSGNL